MIKINLIPVKDERYIASARFYLIVSAILLVATAIFMFSYASRLSAREVDRALKIKALEEKILVMKDNIAQVEALKKQKKDLEGKIQMIVRLNKDNIGPVRMFDELSLKIPSNKIWVDNFVTDSKTFQLVGTTLDNKEVANFMKHLEKSMFFSDIELKELKRASNANSLPTLTYTLSGTMNFAGAVEKPVEEAQKPEEAPKAKKR